MYFSDHYTMEKFVLKEAFGSILYDFMNNEKILINTNLPCLSISTVTFGLFYAYSELFNWIYEQENQALKDKLEEILETRFSMYIPNSYYKKSIKKFLKEFLEEDPCSEENLLQEYYVFIEQYNRKHTGRLAELLQFHERIEKVFNCLLNLRKNLDILCEELFLNNFLSELTEIESITEQGLSRFNLIVHAAEALRYDFLPKDNGIIHCSLFSDVNTKLYKARKVGLVYKPKDFIFMKEKDNQCNLWYHRNEDISAFNDIVKSFHMVERIALDKDIINCGQGLDACRILPMEYFRERSIGYSEIVIESSNYPCAIFAYDDTVNRRELEACAYFYNLPVIYFDGKKIRKIM